jgi:hypothetical protein
MTLICCAIGADRRFAERLLSSPMVFDLETTGLKTTDGDGGIARRCAS